MVPAPEDCSTNRPCLPAGEALGALALYGLGALAFLGPALLSGGRLVLGHPESDVWKHLWGAWWLNQHLRQGSFSTWTDLQNFPTGGSLYVIDPLNAGLTALLEPLFGLVGAYNAVMAFQVVASALAAFALARWLTGDGRAALVAGAAYGFCPFLLTSGVSSGIAETSNLAWLPLAVLGLLRGLEGRGGWASVGLGGLGLALSAMGSWYFGMTAMVFGLGLAAWTAWTGAPPIPGAGRAHWTRPILACGLAALLTLPLALLFAATLKGEGSLLARVDVSERLQESSLEFLHRKGNFKNDADLVSYLAPGKERLSMADDVDRRMKSVYAGLLVLALALLGLARGGPWTRFWGLAVLGMALLSVGPYLNLAPGRGLPGPWNPLYMLAYHAIPGFRMVAIADRLSIAAQMGLAVLAAAGLAGRLPRGFRGTALAVGLAALVMLEVTLLSPVPWPLPTSPAAMPAVARALAGEPARQGVVPLPLNRSQASLQPGEYYYWQTGHGKPMPLALTTRFPQAMMENLLVGTLYLCEDPAYGTPPPPEALRPGLEALKREGFGWIMVSGDLMNPGSARKVERLLTGLLGAPRRFDGRGLLYRLAGSPTPGRPRAARAGGPPPPPAAPAPSPPGPGGSPPSSPGSAGLPGSPG